jgi:DNA-binding response OmpR family regulator
MKLLIAEDDILFRGLLQRALAPDHEIIVAQDGVEAWTVLQRADAPRLAILDWVMPGLSGPEVCRNIRQSSDPGSIYVILLTARNSLADVASGLRAGADDYITKPFYPEILRARVKVGERIVTCQRTLSAQVNSLEDALAREKQLRDLLSFCPRCREPVLDEDYLHKVRTYLSQHPQPGGDASPSGCHKGLNPQFQLTAASSKAACE